MTVKYYIVLVGVLILTSGCASLSNFEHEIPDKASEPDILASLQHFSGEIAEKSAKERSDLCSALFQKEPVENRLLHELQLSYAIAITPGCGSLSEALSLIESARENARDGQLIQQIDYQILILKRLRGISRYALDLKSKANKSQEKATVLELKLEAIKSIEKALNKRD